MRDVILPTIILRTDNKMLNEKGMKVNLYLKEISKEKSVFLIYNSRKIKAQNLGKDKSRLTKYG